MAIKRAASIPRRVALTCMSELTKRSYCVGVVVVGYSFNDDSSSLATAGSRRKNATRCCRVQSDTYGTAQALSLMSSARGRDPLTSR